MKIIVERLSGLKKKSCTIGYLEGTFDLFHVGHLNFIEEAKAKCDYLLVGVYSDEVVNSYKGHYPIIPCKDRIRIIKALKNVDSVHLLNERDKINAYQKYNYSILFMSTDWKHTPEYAHLEDTLRKYNVNVIWIPYLQGISTSRIIKQITSCQSIGY